MDVDMNEDVELPEFDVSKHMEKGDCTEEHVTGNGTGKSSSVVSAYRLVGDVDE